METSVIVVMTIRRPEACLYLCWHKVVTSGGVYSPSLRSFRAEFARHHSPPPPLITALILPSKILPLKGKLLTSLLIWSWPIFYARLSLWRYRPTERRGEYFYKTSRLACISMSRGRGGFLLNCFNHSKIIVRPLIQVFQASKAIYNHVCWMA